MAKGGLTKVVREHIIGGMKKQTLAPKERKAQALFMGGLSIRKRKTKKPVIVAMVGLVGSGKSSVAQALARHIGAAIIAGDDIRVELRKLGQPYRNVGKIGENAVLKVIKQGSNVVLDSDFIDPKKQAGIRKKAREIGAHLVFIRTVCDFDIMTGRVLTATYRDRVDDFFGGAKSKWQGSEQSKGAAVKVREMWRRTPHHYDWVNRGGGHWALKKFPFAIFAEIDTIDPGVWRRGVEKCAKRLLAH